MKAVEEMRDRFARFSDAALIVSTDPAASPSAFNWLIMGQASTERCSWGHAAPPTPWRALASPPTPPASSSPHTHRLFDSGDPQREIREGRPASRSRDQTGVTPAAA